MLKACVLVGVFSSAAAECDLASDLQHIWTARGVDYPRQRVTGPMQADEMLLLFGLVRTSSVARVLEIGGFKGDSAYNFLQALKCKVGGSVTPMVVTVDLSPIKPIRQHIVAHRTLRKNAINLTMDDVEGQPVDAILLDCHAFYASQHILANVFEHGLLSSNGFVILHDTGLHATQRYGWALHNHEPAGWVHQPVERLIAQWLQAVDCSFQRISAHDDARVLGPRHGLTIMQRRIDLTVNNCASGKRAFMDYEPADCRAVQSATRQSDERCRAYMLDAASRFKLLGIEGPSKFR